MKQLGGPRVLCRFVGGPLDGQQLCVDLGVYKVQVPVLGADGFGAYVYTIAWHDDGPVAT